MSYFPEDDNTTHLTEYFNGERINYTRNARVAQCMDYKGFYYTWRYEGNRGTSVVCCEDRRRFELLLRLWNASSDGWHYGENGPVPFSFFCRLVTSRPFHDSLHTEHLKDFPFHRPLEDTEQDKAYLRSQYRRFCAKEKLPEMWGAELAVT